MDAFHKLSHEEKQGIVDYLDKFSLYEGVTVNGTQFIIVYAGHYHVESQEGLVRIMFNDYEELL